MIKVLQNNTMMELNAHDDIDIADFDMNPVYSPLSQSYYKEYFSDKTISDMSIIIEINNKPVIYIPIFSFDLELTYFGMPVNVFYNLRAEKEDVHEATKQLEHIFKKSPYLSEYNNITYRSDENINSILMNNECSYDTENELFVDLEKSEIIIKKEIRKSYKSLINWGKKNLTLKVFEQNNFDESCIDEFKAFHFKVSGKVTRNDSSWDKQGELIKNGQSFLMMSYMNNQLVSASLIMHSVNQAYYGVGVYDRDLMAEKLPLSHYIVFKSIEICKQNGIKKYIIGNYAGVTTDKESFINKFKKGFTSTVNKNLIVTANI